MLDFRSTQRAQEKRTLLAQCRDVLELPRRLRVMASMRFWDLHRKLAECYEEDLILAASKGTTVSVEQLPQKKRQESEQSDGEGLTVEHLHSIPSESGSPSPPLALPATLRKLPSSGPASPVLQPASPVSPSPAFVSQQSVTEFKASRRDTIGNQH